MRIISMKLPTMMAALVLAGCSSFTPLGPTEKTPPAAPAPIGKSTAPVGDVCNVQAAQWAVGKTPTARVVEDARVRSGARMARVMQKGQVTTMEFDQQRLNLELDAEGKIVAARCG